MNLKNSKTVYLRFGFCVGLLSMCAQLSILREVMVVFNGNELVTAFFLSFWLVFTGCGSLVSKYQQQTANSLVRNTSLFIVLSPFLPLLIHVLPEYLHFGTTGSSILNLSILSLLLLPICIVNGSLYALPVMLVLTESKDHNFPGTLYALESAGSVVSALIFAGITTSGGNTLILYGVFIVATTLVLKNLIKTKHLVAGLLFGTIVAMTGPQLFHWSQRLSYSPYTLLETIDTHSGRYHLLEYHETKNLLFNNQPISFNNRNRIIETAGCISLGINPDIKQTLIIEGLSSGLNTFLLENSHSTVLQLCQDQIFAKNFFMKTSSANHFPSSTDRLKIIYDNPRHSITELNPQSLDTVFLLVKPSFTLNSSRFFSREFFSDIQRILRLDGIFIMILPGSENVMNQPQAHLLKVVTNTLETAFHHDNILLLPGDDIICIASPERSFKHYDPTHLINTLNQLNPKTLYSTEAYIPFMFNSFNISSFQTQLNQSDFDGIASDNLPLVFSLFVDLWKSKWGVTSDLLTITHLKQFSVILALVCILCFCFRFASSRSQSELTSVTCLSGGSVILAEIMLLFTIQTATAAMYVEMGVLIACVGLGITAGSILGKVTQNSFTRIVICQLATALLFLGVFILPSFQCSPPLPFYYTVAMLFGASGGYIFSSSTALAPNNAPILYFVDLSGAAAGSACFALLFLPAMGFFETALFATVANVSPVFYLLFHSRRAE